MVLPYQSSQFEYRPVYDDTDVQRLKAILVQCFIASPTDEENFLTRLGPENVRLICHGRQIVGGLALIAMGQWWGQQCVPMVGIGGVVIAPEYRGSGAAIALMSHALEEIYTRGVSLSVLYPATQRLYRKAGYEQGGTLCKWEIATEAIQLRNRDLLVSAVNSTDDTLLYDLYRQQASLTNGYIDRPLALWKQLLASDPNQPIYGNIFGTPHHPEGYVLFSQQRTSDGTILHVKDWVALTPKARQRFWSFLADHRSQIDRVHWRGAVVDPLVLLLPEQGGRICSTIQWMIRLVNVPLALEQRGYPPTLEGELHFKVRDDLLAENQDNFILSVAQGKGQVTRGGTGDLTIDVRGLAPLYSGLFTAHQLQLAGYLDAPDPVQRLATHVFAGASPWMLDFF